MNLVAILLLIVAYLLSMILLFFVYRKARRWNGVLPCAALSVAEFLALVGWLACATEIVRCRGLPVGRRQVQPHS